MTVYCMSDGEDGPTHFFPCFVQDNVVPVNVDMSHLLVVRELRGVRVNCVPHV
jgi:hypothetical protein